MFHVTNPFLYLPWKQKNHRFLGGLEMTRAIKWVNVRFMSACVFDETGYSILFIILWWLWFNVAVIEHEQFHFKNRRRSFVFFNYNMEPFRITNEFTSVFFIFKIKISQQRFCHIFTFLLKYFIISNLNAFWRTMSYGSTSSPALVIPPVHQVSTNLGFIHCIIFQDIFFPELHSIPCRSCKELTSIVSFWFSMLQM